MQQQFIKKVYYQLINEYNDYYNENIQRLLHSHCPPATTTYVIDGETHVIEYDKQVEGDDWCSAWDEEKAMYCTTEELDTHLAGCNHVRESWLLNEFENMLLNVLPKINNKVSELARDFEDCPCGFYRSIRTKVCSRCLIKGRADDNKNEDN